MSQPRQQQSPPQMVPEPDHGEESYRGPGRLTGKAAVITGGGSGIGRAVAIAYAREGADVLDSCLDEHEGAEETRRWVTEAGHKCVLVPGDVADPARCRSVVDKAVEEFGRVDVLVDNVAFQLTRDSIEVIPEERNRTPVINISAFFHLTKAAVPHMRPGSAIIGSTSVNSDSPPPQLLAYNITKAGIADMVGSLAQMPASKSIRVNSVAPGPIWTPLVPANMPPEEVESFGPQVPLGRRGRPAEPAAVYVMPGSDEAGYVSEARIADTGGQAIL